MANGYLLLVLNYLFLGWARVHLLYLAPCCGHRTLSHLAATGLMAGLHEITTDIGGNYDAQYGQTDEDHDLLLQGPT